MNGHAETDSSIAAILRRFSSCDISDALEKLGVSHGGYVSGPTLWSPERQAGDTRIAGPAHTVQYVNKSDVASPSTQGHYIETVPDGSVLFIAAPPNSSAVFGGLMGTRAKARGAVGAVIHGPIRDLEDHRRRNFPVFATKVAPTGPYNSVRVASVNSRLDLDTEGRIATIRPGDYIVADLNGVVCVPAELTDKVVKLATVLAEANARIADDLEQGISFVHSSKQHRGGP